MPIRSSLLLRASGRGRYNDTLKRFELACLAVCAACAVTALLARLDVVSVADSIPLGLYPFYGLAAAAGWLSGNIYVARTRDAGFRLKSLLLPIYMIGPAGPISLLTAMGASGSQERAPLAPVFAFGVFLMLFFVPVTLRFSASSSRPSSVPLSGLEKSSGFESPSTVRLPRVDEEASSATDARTEPGS